MQQKPVHVITGFLGAGKTTLLNALMEREELSNSLLIINEFGAVSVDHEIISAPSETILELSNGCLCCSVRGDLVDALLQFDAERFDRVFIETTGVADPSSIFQTIAAHPYLTRILLPGTCICVFDANRSHEMVERYEEAARQIAFADTLFVRGSETSASGDETSEHIRNLNPTAAITGNVEDIEFSVRGLSRGASQLTPKIDSNHASRFNSQVLTLQSSQNLRTIEGFCFYLSQQLGEKLLRAKGLFNCQDKPSAPLLIQMSGPHFHPPVYLESWKDTPVQSQLVVITEGIPKQHVQDMFDGFFEGSAIDRPDRTAIEANPLAIPGFGGN